MSRIGRVPLKISPGVSYNLSEERIVLKGNLGEIVQAIPKGFTLNMHEGCLKIECESSQKTLTKEQSVTLGTLCRLVKNGIVGVSVGFEKVLELVGVGYKAEAKGQILKLSLGYSHDISYVVPDGVTVKVEKATVIKLFGVCKQKLGQVVSEIIRFRKPEPYKGKGIRIQGQHVRIKQRNTK